MSMPKSKLISSAVMLAVFGLSLTFALLTASKAWFSENKVVKANGMAVEVKSPSSITIHCEMFDMLTDADDAMPDNPTTGHYYFSSEPTDDGAMSPYLVDKPEAIYKLLKFTVTLTGEGTSIPALTLSAHTTITEYMSGSKYPLIKYVHEYGTDENGNKIDLGLAVDGSGHYIKIDNKKEYTYPYEIEGETTADGEQAYLDYDNSISNIIVFNTTKPTIVYGNEIETDENGNQVLDESGNPVYKVSHFVVSSMDEPLQFFNTDSAEHGWTSGSSTLPVYELPEYTKEGYDPENGDPLTYDFYLLVSYDGLLLSELFAENIGNPNLVDEGGFVQYGGVDFVNDFSFVFAEKKDETNGSN